MEGVFLSGEGMFELEGMSEVLQGAILEGFDQRNVKADGNFSHGQVVFRDCDIIQDPF